MSDPVSRMSIDQVANEALEHVAQGDSYGSKAENPTTIRTRQLLERLAEYVREQNVR